MRSNNPVRWTIGAALALLVGLSVASCSKTVAIGGPEEPGPTGFEGDWVGTFQGSEIVLRIGDFGRGGNQATGQVLWRDVEWGLLCTVRITPETSEIECDVQPSAEVAFCGDPDPFVDIDNAVPRAQINASVGGILREGAGNPCDGEVLVSWEPTAGVIFTPG
jgi:hypothetical protein